MEEPSLILKQTIDKDRIAALCDCDSNSNMTGGVASRLQQQRFQSDIK